MYKHHEESLENMTAHYRENPEIKALFLIGSVATGTERPDSDIDGVAIVSQEVCEHKKRAKGLRRYITANALTRADILTYTT